MLNLKKILLPVDFSSRSSAVVPYVKAFASQLHSQFLIVHVEHGPILDQEVGIMGVQAGRVIQIKWARHELESFLSDELDSAVIKRDLLEGDPARKIVEYARANDVDLIMMPTHGYGPYRRFLLGSVTAKVLHDCDYPIWTATHAEDLSPQPVSCRKIACAIDLGPHSEQVISAASSLASSLGSELLVIHVTEHGRPMMTHQPAIEWDLRLAEGAREEIQKLLKKLNIEAEIAIESGAVALETDRRAMQFGASLLVIGRHAAKGPEGWLHPHAYAFIRESPCPVVSI